MEFKFIDHMFLLTSYNIAVWHLIWFDTDCVPAYSLLTYRAGALAC